MNTTSNNSPAAVAPVVSAPAARISLHSIGTNLSEVPGFAVLTVKGDPKSGRPGATFRAPALELPDVLALAATNDALGAHILGGLCQLQREIVRAALLNGANPANGASVAGESLELAALVEFLGTSGSSTIRFTKALMGELRPVFALLVAARWAEVKPEAASQMSDSEILAASRQTLDFYWPMLEAATQEKAMLDDRAQRVLPILALAASLSEASPEIGKFAPAFAVLSSKVSAAMNRSVDFEPDC